MISAGSWKTHPTTSMRSQMLSWWRKASTRSITSSAGGSTPILAPPRRPQHRPYRPCRGAQQPEAEEDQPDQPDWPMIVRVVDEFEDEQAQEADDRGQREPDLPRHLTRIGPSCGLLVFVRLDEFGFACGMNMVHRDPRRRARGTSRAPAHAGRPAQGPHEVGPVALLSSCGSGRGMHGCRVRHQGLEWRT